MVSKSIVIICCFFLCRLLAICQIGDTIYFNKSWKSCKKKDATYYRLVEKVDSIYKIQDFYKSGILQMRASAISIEPEIFEGQCYYYYGNGNVESFGVYHKGKSIGIWTYYDEKGDIINTYNYSTSIETSYTPKKLYKKAMSETDKNFSFAVRGKLFGFVIIEDNYFSTATLGTEFLIKGRHSLGVDFTYFGWQYEKDDIQDSPLYETYERRTYFYFDYKYRFLSYKKLDFYFNLYDKIGTYHMWQEGVSEGYNTWEKPWLNDKIDGTFNQVGAGLGFKSYFSEQFYIDISANAGKLFSNNNTIVHDSLGIAEKQYHIKSDKNIFYIRINFGYKLFVKRKNEEEVFYTN